MSKQLLLKIVTPEKLILEELVDQVTLPTTEGELTILPDHVSMIAGLASGDVVAYVASEHVPMAVSGGFIEVKQVSGQTEVAILADFAEHVADITEDVIPSSLANLFCETLKIDLHFLMTFSELSERTISPTMSFASCLLARANSSVTLSIYAN